MAGVAPVQTHLKDAAADATMAVEEDASPLGKALRSAAAEPATATDGKGKKLSFLDKLKQKQAEKAAEK